MIINNDFDPLPASVPQSLQKIISRALYIDPLKRYQSADEMRVAILLALTPRAEEKLETTSNISRLWTPMKRFRSSQRRIFPWVIVIALLAAFVITGLIIRNLLDATIPVPDLVGQTIVAAQRSVGDDFDIQDSYGKISDGPTGAILSQAPEPGKQALRGSTISVVTSVGGGIFHDFFGDPSSGWPKNSIEGISSDYDSGGYHINFTPNLNSKSIYITAPIEAARIGEDAIVEMDASMTTDTPDGGYFLGVTCRVIDFKNFYQIGISNEGMAGIFKEKDGNLTPLAIITSPNDSLLAIQQGTSNNHIRGDCVGSTLTLYVNNEKLLEADDTEFESGQVGLWVENDADNDSGTEVLFKDFLVSRPL